MSAMPIILIAGISSLLLLWLSIPELKQWKRRQTIIEKLRVLSEAIEQAEERLLRFQERHDRILYQLNSQYMSHREMEEALAGARRAMDEALEFSACLQRVQLKIVSSYPYGSSDRVRPEWSSIN